MMGSHWGMISRDKHSLTYVLNGSLQLLRQNTVFVYSFWVEQEQRGWLEDYWDDPNKRCRRSGLDKAEQRMEDWVKDSSEVFGLSHWDEWWHHLLSWWTLGENQVCEGNIKSWVLDMPGLSCLSGHPKLRDAEWMVDIEGWRYKS